MIDLSKIPIEPGCYFYKDTSGIVIYIGKAKNLKKRVSSYFQKKEHDPKTQALVSNIDSVETIITSNEKEALILENNLILKYKPKYNINLKDSRRYAYILLTNEEFPRLIVAREKSENGTYFGPFTSAEQRDTVLKFANNLFKIRTCRKLPKRACLRFHMGLCDAPCIARISRENYLAQVERAKKFLTGKSDELVKELKEKMDEYSKALEFEQAKIIRDQIYAIESLKEKQNVETQKDYDQDIINYIMTNGMVHLAVFSVNSGILLGKSEFDFSEKDGFLEEFILQYYSDEKIPKEIIIPEKVSSIMPSILSEKKGSRVRITVPERGEKKELLTLVQKNLEKAFVEDELNLNDLKEKLRLPTLPKIIECFDISHLSGTNTVGSMVRFVNGKPDKSGYRRFKIKTIENIDDYASIAEIVKRRYEHLLLNKLDLPDLIVIDGGKGQLSAAFDELRKLGLKIPTISLAKRNEEVYFPGLSVPRIFDRKSRALQLLQRVRDEAHRFAITYQKLLRDKRILKS